MESLHAKNQQLQLASTAKNLNCIFALYSSGKVVKELGKWPDMGSCPTSMH